MSVQGEVNKALGTAAAAASIAKGISVAKEKEAKAADKEEAAKAEEKKIQERQDLLFLEQSQNKIEGQRKSIEGLDKKIEKNQQDIAKFQKAARYKRSGKEAMAEAKASLADALEQDRIFKADKAERKRLLAEREQMAANVRKEFNYGEK